MKPSHNLVELANELSSIENEQVIIQESTYTKELTHVGDSMSMLAKVFLTLGVLLGSVLVMLLFFISFHLYESQAISLILGIGVCALGIFLNRSKEHFIPYLIGAIAFVSGFVFINFGMFSEGGGLTFNLFMNIFICTLSVFLVESFILPFIAIFIAICSIISLFQAELNLHANTFLLPIFIIAFYLTRIQEIKIYTHSPKWIEHFNALSQVLLITILLMLFVNYENWFDNYFKGYQTYDFMAITADALIVYESYLLSRKFELNTSKISIVLIIICVILACLFNAPAISVTLLLLISSFKSNYRPGLILSILALIYALISFYYNIQITLLQKSIWLIVSGGLCLLGYYFIIKNQNSDAKV